MDCPYFRGRLFVWITCQAHSNKRWHYTGDTLVAFCTRLLALYHHHFEIRRGALRSYMYSAGFVVESQRVDTVENFLLPLGPYWLIETSNSGARPQKSMSATDAICRLVNVTHVTDVKSIFGISNSFGWFVCNLARKAALSICKLEKD